MKKCSLIILLVFSVLFANAQLEVNHASAEQAVLELLGAGVTASNIEFNGDPLQLGIFNGVRSNIGLNAGVIISCGDIISSVGPNNTPGRTLPSGGFRTSGDADLSAIIGGSFLTGDAGILEFDFVPDGDIIKFKYAFGSEEYNEYVCAAFNDVFGFFISGPNPLGGNYNAKNLAIVPGTVSTPVSINTVNNGTVGGSTSSGISFNCSTIDPNWASYSNFFSDNNRGLTVQYDGFTKVLEAKVAVVCGESYHFKIAIADGGKFRADYILDSGVFIEAGSFSSNKISLTSNIDVTPSDSILFEGCGKASLYFVRSDISETEVYNYSIIGSSASATDYIMSADNLIFLEGEDSLTLTFTAINDGIVEPLERLTIMFTQTICNIIDTQQVTFYISDYTNPGITIHDEFTGCVNKDLVPLWVEVTGPTHLVSWNTTPVQNTDTIWVNPNLTQEYIVEVTNTCGFTIVDTIKVVDSPLSLIDLTMSLDVTKSCLKDSVEIYVVASGGGGIFTYSWNPSGSTDSSFYVNPIISTIYVVEVTDICGVVEKDSLKITVPQFESLVANVFNIDDTICVSDLVVLTGCATGGVGAYFTWNEGLGSVSPVSVNPTETTTYVLTAQDICGAMEIDSVTISTDLVHLHLPDSIALTCFDETVILDPTITGGNGNETYFWDAGATTSTLSVAPTKTTVYAVTVQTDDGCPSIVDTVKVIVPTFMPMEVSVNKDLTIPCPGDPLPLVAVFKGGSDHSHVQIWSDGENVFNGNNNIVRPLVDTEYTLLCIDICAKDSASANFTVKMPNYDPLVVVVFSADTLICIGSYADLAIRVSGGDGNYAYSWSNGYTTPSIQVFPKFNTTYDVVATDGCKTQVDTSVDVTVSAPVANFSFEYVSPIEIQFNNLSYNNIVAYTWTFDNATSIEEDPLHSFDKSGIHNVWLVVEDENTCVDSIMRIVRPLFFIYSPNAFSSNGDRLNEEFKFKGDGVKSFQLYIYNSWGELLFKTDNIHNGWDGTYNGKKVSAGVYLYKVRAESYQQDIVEEVGKLTLIK